MTTAALVCLFFASCQGQEAKSEIGDTVQISDMDSQASVESQPHSNDELFDYVMGKWKNGAAEELYRFASEEIVSLMDQTAFAEMFDCISEIGGALLNIQKNDVSVKNGIDVYNASLEFEHITVALHLSLQDVKICGFVRDIYFNEDFEVSCGNGVTERYFVLKNDGCALNAVYTYSDQSKKAPSVLLISGSGPSDYNETVGALTPFEDIARELAAQGISSLRVDKRTLHYADASPTTDIEKEYLTDCRAALSWLREQERTESVYLLGHSLGGQIAAVLAAEDGDVRGMILFNSTPRHMADVLYDQLAAADPSNKSTYSQYTEAAKGATVQNAKGAYFYGGSDYYWASYNTINTAKNIQEAKIPALIINSTYDNQLFAEDIRQWSDLFAGDSAVIIKCYDDLSHFGYKIDTKDQTQLYAKTEFPTELIDDFCSFVQ